jgi:Ca2+-binding RTX toxin-like protein
MAIINDTLGNSNLKLQGTDELDIINAFDGDDAVYGRSGNDFIFGGSGNDVLYGDFPKQLEFEGNDYLDGGLGDDRLYGNGGNDRLVDLFGNNSLDGGTGDDVLIAGLGNDQLLGGEGSDRLTGGLGKDMFYLTQPNGIDTITDFNVNDDVMVVPVKDVKDFEVVANDELAATSLRVLVYSKGTGNLFLNVNEKAPGFGEGGGQIATLLGLPNLSAANFRVEPK